MRHEKARLKCQNSGIKVCRCNWSPSQLNEVIIGRLFGMLLTLIATNHHIYMDLDFIQTKTTYIVDEI